MVFSKPQLGRGALWLIGALIVAGAAVLYFGESFRAEISPEERAARAAGEDLARNGGEGVPACVGCHGAQGEGNWELGYPRLAGLHPDYIAKQLEDFARPRPTVGVATEPIARDYEKTPDFYKDLTIYSPGIREDEIMTPIARALSPTERRAVAAYYGSLAFETRPEPADITTLERGRQLALRGKPEYLMPRCDACHAPRGQGFGPHFPPLAGQPPKYIIEQINRWQAGTRDNDPLAMMKNTANLLTDGDKANVAAYYANQSLSVTPE